MFLKFAWKMLKVKLSLHTSRRAEGYTYSATHFFPGSACLVIAEPHAMAAFVWATESAVTTEQEGR